jgi:hypothetical protein
MFVETAPEREAEAFGVVGLHRSLELFHAVLDCPRRDGVEERRADAAPAGLGEHR